jgi:hypothetical protein
LASSASSPMIEAANDRSASRSATALGDERSTM